MLKKCALHKCILRKSPAVQVHGLPSKGKNTRVRLNNNHHRETKIKDTRQSSFFFLHNLQLKTTEPQSSTVKKYISTVCKKCPHLRAGIDIRLSCMRSHNCPTGHWNKQQTATAKEALYNVAPRWSANQPYFTVAASTNLTCRCETMCYVPNLSSLLVIIQLHATSTLSVLSRMRRSVSFLTIDYRSWKNYVQLFIKTAGVKLTEGMQVNSTFGTLQATNAVST